MLLESVYPPDIRVEKEARALVAGGHDVYVLSYTAPDNPTRETIDGATVIRRPVQASHAGGRGSISGLRYLLTYVHSGWWQAASGVIESEGIDVLHAHDLPVVKTAIKLGDRYDIPVVADLHENWPEAKRHYRKGTLWQNAKSNPRLVLARLLKSHWRLKQFERYSVRHADQVITVVDEGKDHYVHDCGASEEAVHVVSNVVDLAVFDEMPTASLAYEDEFVVSYVGTLSGEHRGLHTVVEAMSTVVDEVENARLLVVGPKSGYARKLEERSRELGIEDHVTFTGRVPFAEVPSYIEASDVCTVPHQRNPHTETTVPHKLFQYMAKRKPVIVTDVTPLARIVNETDAGVVVPAEDNGAMAGAIVDLAADHGRRAQLGTNGRMAVENRYNWRVEGEKLLELYQTLDPEPSRRPSQQVT